MRWFGRHAAIALTVASLTCGTGEQDSTSLVDTYTGVGDNDDVCLGSTPRPTPQGETPSGIEQCEDGSRHSVSAEVCELPDAPAIGSCPANADPANSSCLSNADCNEGKRGRCNWDDRTGPPFSEFAHCSCAYSCETDADCDSEACVCTSASCYPSECRTNDDCGEGSLCRPSYTGLNECYPVLRLRCSTREDECQSYGDDCCDTEQCHLVGDRMQCVNVYPDCMIG